MERNDIIGRLEEVKEEIDTLIVYLKNHIEEKYDNQTISEFISIYDNEGRNYDEIFERLNEEYGDEKLCEFVDNAKTENE